MGTSYFSNAEYLYSYIEQGNTQQAADLVKNHPQLLNSQLTDDSRVTALGRATIRGNYALCSLLLGMGADVNLMSNGMTPLMIAAQRGYANIIRLLREYNADLGIKTEDCLDVLDYAILYGNYGLALILIKEEGLTVTKDAKEYRNVASRKKSYYVNYDRMLKSLQSLDQEGSVGNLFTKPPRPQLQDPVIDPNQTWGHFLRRVSEFEPPPLVERSSLPDNLQPQNRVLGKVHYYIEKLKGDTRLSLQPKYDSSLPSNRRHLNQTDI